MPKITELQKQLARVSGGAGLMGTPQLSPSEYLARYTNALWRLWQTPFKLEPLEDWQPPAKRETRVRVTCLRCNYVCKKDIKLENLLQYDRIKHPCDKCMSPIWLQQALNYIIKELGTSQFQYELFDYPGKKAKIHVISPDSWYRIKPIAGKYNSKKPVTA